MHAYKINEIDFVDLAPKNKKKKKSIPYFMAKLDKTIRIILDIWNFKNNTSTKK